MSNYQQPYYPPAYPPVVPQQTSSMATISLITGIASYVILPLIGAIIAVITGNMARKEIAASGGQIGGGGMATACLVLGWVNIGLSVLGMCLIFALIALPILLAATSAGSY